jgi:ankyrin repeat protein
VIDREFMLHFAVRFSHTEVIRVMLTYGANPNASPALREAVNLRVFDIVKLLVEAGADISDCHYDALRLAKETRQMDMYLYLQEHAESQYLPSASARIYQRRFINETCTLPIVPGHSSRNWV